MAPTPSRIVAAGTFGLCAAAGIALWAFHAACFFPTWTDENIHLYVAGRLAEGARLYRDIHSARPPLALYPLALLLKTGLAPLTAARGLVLGVTLLTGAVLAWTGRRLAGPWAGALACALFLLAPEVAARHTFTAIQLVALCTTLSVALALLDRPASAGAAAALGLACGQHAAVLAAGAFVFALLRSRRGALRFALAAAAVLALVFGAAAALSSPAAIFEDLLGKHLYHLKTQPVPESDGDLRWYLVGAAFDHALFLPLAALALLAARGKAGLSLAAGVRQAPDQRRALLAVALLLAAQFAVVAALRGSLILYLFPAVPLAALLCGVGLDAGLRALIGALRDARTRSLRAAIRAGVAAALAAALFALAVAGASLARDRYQARDQERYPLLAQSRHLAMARLQKLDIAATLAGVVRAELQPGQTIFGYPTIATAVATQAGCRISGELADLAPRWIAQGTVSRRDVVNALEKDHVRFFVTPRLFFEQDKFFRDYLEHCFSPPRRFLRGSGDGHGIPSIDLFERREGIACAPKAAAPGQP